jgi:hypothetical protein
VVPITYELPFVKSCARRISPGDAIWSSLERGPPADELRPSEKFPLSDRLTRQSMSGHQSADAGHHREAVVPGIGVRTIAIKA